MQQKQTPRGNRQAASATARPPRKPNAPVAVPARRATFQLPEREATYSPTKFGWQ